MTVNRRGRIADANNRHNAHSQRETCMSTTSTSVLFPPLTPAYFLAFQFSSWFPKFAHLSIKSTVIRPLSPEFRAYLNADGVFVPQGSEDVSVSLPLGPPVVLSLRVTHPLQARAKRALRRRGRQ